MISDLTYLVIAETNHFNPTVDECVDWALEMLDLGFETESLVILAGLGNRRSFYEIKLFLNNAIHELGLEKKKGNEAITSCSYFYISQMSKGKKVRVNLSRLLDTRINNYPDSIVQDFYYLNWAWSDLDYDDSYPTEYWPGVSKTNIESKVIEVSKSWLSNNKQYEISIQD